MGEAARSRRVKVVLRISVFFRSEIGSKIRRFFGALSRGRL